MFSLPRIERMKTDMTDYAAKIRTTFAAEIRSIRFYP